MVQTSTGPQFTFLTLRELQRAILAKQVARHDVLLQAGVDPRPLASIAELEPFFDGRTSSRPPPTGSDGANSPIPPQVAHPPPQTPPLDPPVDRSSLLRDGAPLRSLDPPRAFVPPDEEVRSPVRMVSSSPPFSSGDMPAHRSILHGDDEADAHVALPPPSSEEPFDIPGRRRVGGWIVAFVLMLAGGIVAWVLVKPYLVAHATAGNSEAASALDGRARGFLVDGEKALADGNLEGAQQSFDKASALAEGDVRVLLDEARVTAAAADVPWLKLRLLPKDAVEELRAARALLDERLARARKAADGALAAAPEDPAAARAEIDALRLAGERDAARGYVSKLGAQASQPETLYVLAALDLAEPEPFWMTVIDRLRRVASVDGSGRARAALVYALVKFGDAGAAKAELAKLDAQPRPYPLLPNLHAMVDETAPRHAAAADANRASGVAGATAVRQGAAAGASAPATAGQSPAGEAVSNDPSTAMQSAAQAIKKGDSARARRIYEALVARNPGDSEALAGIGDVDRLEGDSSRAIGDYKRALAVNPSYLAALLGVADTEWASGDHAKGRAAYKEITDRFPEGTYPAYVATRAESSPSPEVAPAAPAPAASAGTKPWDPGNGI